MKTRSKVYHGNSVSDIMHIEVSIKAVIGQSTTIRGRKLGFSLMGWKHSKQYNMILQYGGALVPRNCLPMYANLPYK